MKALALGCLLAAGCFIPSIDDGDVACGPGGACPDGLTCAVDGLCRRNADGGEPSDLTGADLTGQDLSGADLLGIDGPCGGPFEQSCSGSCEGGACVDSDQCVPSGVALGAMVCIAGTSTTCGAVGQPCCADSKCNNASDCCAGGVCVAAASTCGPGAGNCGNGSCGSCGGPTKKCCAGGNGNAEFCTASGLACDSAMNCATCGGAGQTCCEGGVCANGACCDATNSTCVASGGACAGAGQCSSGGCLGGTCGKLGQPACPGLTGCTAPRTVSQGGLCVACGGNGEVCCRGNSGGWCAEPYACNATGSCEPCGGPGQVCCSGKFCASGMNCTVATGKCP